ncbi:hypothetical protein NQ314_012711 [Rhamnusium bicolor]|uniref:Peptidase A2 domain-containing protein n=1 Tax=Rhamnusium bicolor TaxID=1586634 RepID=A0AAV8XA39_9CUCU|nr:hypothetical protein NQ314_012711 [Rhamnusium bicolor]
MAEAIKVTPPDKFNFTNPATWPQWIKRFNRYMSVSGMSSKTDKEKIDILLYVMGEESEDVLIQFPTVSNKYHELVKAFEDYFIPRRNVIFERFQFNSRVQRPGENIDSFITTLHNLAEYCEYGALKDSLIRDRIVVGMSDKKTSEKLQLQHSLTLPEAILAAKQAEIQAHQNNILRQESQVSSISQKKSVYSKPSVKTKNNPKNPSFGESCQFCGLEPHEREVCPARASKCRNCSRRGHWDRVCKSRDSSGKKFIKMVNTEDNNSECNEFSSADQQFLGVISLSHINVNNNNHWVVDINVNEINKQISFLVDTGADIICIPQHLLPKNLENSLWPCNESISGLDGTALKVLGKLKMSLGYKDKMCTDFVYVIRDLKTPILGRPGIVNIVQEYPLIFDLLGEFKDEISIQVNNDAKPYVQTSPRVVPIPLLSKLENELNRLMKLDIIVPVELPTAWTLFPLDRGRLLQLIFLNMEFALMSYRSTPLECGFSPAELLMSRKIKTTLPLLPSKLEETVDTKAAFSAVEGKRKDKQCENFDLRHKAKELSELKLGDSVWVTDLRSYGKVVKKCEEPRSYVIQTQNGVYRRNRWFLITAPYCDKEKVTQFESPIEIPKFSGNQYTDYASVRGDNNDGESASVQNDNQYSENASNAHISECMENSPNIQPDIQEGWKTEDRPKRVSKKTFLDGRLYKLRFERLGNGLSRKEALCGLEVGDDRDNLCNRREAIRNQREVAKAGLEKQAEKNVLLSREKLPSAECGQNVVVKVPDVDRGRLAPRNSRNSKR